MYMGKLIFAGVGLAGMLAASAASAVTSEADSVLVDWGTYAGFGGDATPGRFDPNSARDNDPGSFFRMGIGSAALFGWGGREIIGSTVVFETTFTCNNGGDADDTTCDNFPEQVDVYAFADDITPMIDGGQPQFAAPDGVSRDNYVFNAAFRSSGTFLETVGNADAQGGFSVDLAPALSGNGGPLDAVFYILLLDSTLDIPNLTQKSFDGFDIESVSATVVPVPAGVLLIGSAFALMGAGRRWLA